MDATEWNARYAGAGELVWGVAPNRFVVAELESMPPGTALDIACGEGRNAVWLAGRGWRVTGVDFSAAGLERAVRLAREAGVEDQVDFVRADVVNDPLPAGRFDAVVVAYLQLPAAERGRALRRAADAVAPDGVLVVVGHDVTNLTHGVGGPQDPVVLFGPEDVIADLGELPDLVVEKAERVHRPVDTPDGERHAVDVLVRMRRISG